MSLHKNIKLVSFLLGKWKGEGSGFFPTIKPFQYVEQVEYSPIPNKPIIFYTQKTQRKHDQVPLHAESGYLRVFDDGKLELILAHTMGLTEICEGKVDGNKIILNSTQFTRTQSAKEPFVTETKRVIEVKDDVLKFSFYMATTTTPELTHHLDAELKKFE